jgi:hypothetical protein
MILLLILILIIWRLFKRSLRLYYQRIKDNNKPVEDPILNDPLPSDTPSVNISSNIQFNNIENNNNYHEDSPYGKYYNEPLHFNYFMYNLPSSCDTAILKYDDRASIIFQEYSSRFSFEAKDPVKFIEEVNMIDFTKRLLNYADHLSSIIYDSETIVKNPYKKFDQKDVFYNPDIDISSLIVRISYLDYVVELIDYQNLIWLCRMNCQEFKDILNSRELNYNIKLCMRKNPVVNYSFKNNFNKVRFNFSKVYFSKDLSRILKVVLEFRIEGEVYMNQFRKEFNEEEVGNEILLLSLY